MNGIVVIVLVGIILMVVVPILSSMNSSLGIIPSYNSAGGTGGTIIYGSMALAQQAATNNTGSALSIASIIPLLTIGSLFYFMIKYSNTFLSEEQEEPEEKVIEDLDEAINDRKVILVGDDALKRYFRDKDMREFKQEIRQGIK